MDRWKYKAPLDLQILPQMLHCSSVHTGMRETRVKIGFIDYKNKIKSSLKLPKNVPTAFDVFCADEHTDWTYCHTTAHTSHKGTWLKISRIETPFEETLQNLSSLTRKTQTQQRVFYKPSKVAMIDIGILPFACPGSIPPPSPYSMSSS